MKLVHITRYKGNNEQSIGILSVYDKNYLIFQCATLELGWHDNARNTSCIPEGNYIVKPHNSPTFGNVFEVQNVKNRSAILIHYGNYNTDTEGCILVGEQIAKINSDGLYDITSSKNTLEKFIKALNYKEFKMIIS